MSAPTYLTKDMFQQTGGRLQIDFGNKDDFDNFAYEIEQKYAIKLFGIKYRSDFLANKSAMWETIRAGELEGWDDGTSYYELHGSTEMLKHFFYYHYIRECQGAKVLSGSAEEAYMVAVNGTKEMIKSNIVKAYNQGVDYYNEIVEYVEYLNSVTPLTFDPFDTVKITEKKNTFGI